MCIDRYTIDIFLSLEQRYGEFFQLTLIYENVNGMECHKIVLNSKEELFNIFSFFFFLFFLCLVGFLSVLLSVMVSFKWPYFKQQQKNPCQSLRDYFSLIFHHIMRTLLFVFLPIMWLVYDVESKQLNNECFTPFF